MDQPQIKVEGEASRWAPADYADVSFTITRRAAKSDKAVKLAGDAYGLLDGVLSEHADAIARRTTAALKVQELFRWEDDRQVHEGFEATRRETARFAPVSGGAGALRDVLTRVPDLLVNGPRFGLDRSNPVHQAVRADAAAAARSSAEAYAAGLGLTLGAVLEMHEPGLKSSDVFTEDAGFNSLMMAKESRLGADETARLVELTDEDVEVTATIAVVFGLTQ